MKVRGYSLYDIEQFIREAGAERVGEDAVLDLERELEKLTEKIAVKALRYAEHAGRKRLIKKEDIMLTRKPSQTTFYRSQPKKWRARAATTTITSSAHK